MKFLTVIVLLIYTVHAHHGKVHEAEECTADLCNIANNCRCSSNASPLAEGQAPQLIVLTFDEAVVNLSYWQYWQPLLGERTNPDGNLISGTFYVPHEYTDYQRVQELYLRGFEIGVASITKNSLVEYWRNATVDTLVQEFGGQRTLLSHFANIPVEDVVGARTPQLQLTGDVSIEAYIQSGVQYDNSWSTRSTAQLFPYTLDYRSTQSCSAGITCPIESHSGFWIAPIIDVQTPGGEECSSLAQCGASGSADDIAAWLNNQLERVRSTTRAPLSLMVSSTFFLLLEHGQEGLQRFLNGLPSDVFLVSQKQALDWVKNPVPLEQFQTEVPSRTATCNPTNCRLVNNNGDVRYMMSCVPCPAVYPWLGNPLGEATAT